MNKKYFASRMRALILPALSATIPHLLLLSAAAFGMDTLAIRIDSAFVLINRANPESAVVIAQKIEPSTLSNAQQTRASRLGLAGLQAQRGNLAWIGWTAKFERKVWSPEERSWLAREALNSGLIPVPVSFLETSSPDNPAFRHDWEILQARLNAAGGDWKQTEARLNAWKKDPLRQIGSGEILFWQGWAALHQHRRDEADTLFTLASAYAEEPASQLALEYRYALLLDSGEALQNFIRGLPESPLPSPTRTASLERIMASSELHPKALWERALILEKSGNREGTLAVLRELAGNPSSLPGRRAAARLAYLRFEPGHRDSAMAAYERLLLQYQQGVPSEFARSRVQALRNVGH